MGALLLPLPLLSFLLFVAFVRSPSFVCGADSSSSDDDTSITPIPRDLYRSSDVLLHEIKALVARHSDSLNMESVRAGSKGYLAEVVVVTYNRVKKHISDKVKFRILMSFGQHGRELITSEVAFRLLSVLTEEHIIPGTEPTTFQNMLDNLVIKVVPMENLNGRKLVEAGDLCERRNGRGVDLNRNWSVDWGKKEKDYDPYEENPGTAPFSEPEAEIMRKLSLSFDPHIWVNVHSGMEALFMPYDHKNTTPSGVAGRLMRSILEDLNHRHFQDKCLVGSGGGSVGYFAHGTTTDYMHDVAKVPMSFTFEIYGNLSASSKDCFRMFNPVDKITFDSVINKWCMAFLTLFQEGPDKLNDARLRVSTLSDERALNGAIDPRFMEDNRGRMRMEVLELGMRELRTYFRLFMLSTILLMFMFCSRISKTKNRQANTSSLVRMSGPRRNIQLMFGADDIIRTNSSPFIL
ncbi:hypothetical protein ACMD2_06696 [Ananas comosus]|uniref:Peptidase M14 domain-containing protein n=2 Tax=Ananas comosus TaxID=4615 RepID=A0A199URM0_ANACO|nr:hypothetical protein ACMD2_06696 [Ananas comosus]